MPPRTLKSASFTNEPVFVTKEGILEPYIPRTILTHRDAYSASLHLLFKHVADVHLLMIEVLAEKYNLDADEIIQTVQNDQRMKELPLNPTLESLTYFTKEDLAKAIDTPVAAITSAPTKPPRKRRIIVKPTVTNVPPADS